MGKSEKAAITDSSIDTMDDFSILLFSIKISSRYHRSRERFWDGWSDIFSIVSVVSGTGAFASVLAELPSQYALSFSFTVALVQAFQLILVPSKKARRHSDLARQFLNLEQKAIAAEFGVDDKKVAELTTERLAIEAAEPPNKRWLLVHFNNELERAEHGEAAKPYVIPTFHRWVMNYRDFWDVTQAKRSA